MLNHSYIHIQPLQRFVFKISVDSENDIVAENILSAFGGECLKTIRKR